MKNVFATIFLMAGGLLAIAVDFDIRNEAEFKKIIPANAKVEKLAGDFKFTEGPVWVPQGEGFLVFSDIPSDALKKWTRAEGITTFRQPSHNANGNTVDKNKTIYTCEHSGRRVAIQKKDGAVETLVDQFEGKKFNSPNDPVVKSDGSVWFTDPDYGLGKNPSELEGNFVFRFDPKSKQLTAVVKDFEKPNGICFSPDEKKLYIADSGPRHHIRVFDVQKNGTLNNGKIFCTIDKGVPDGIRCDKKGRIWSSAGDGVHIFAPDGSLIGKILVPETPANLGFGGKDGKTLFITARTSLYAISILQK